MYPRGLLLIVLPEVMVDLPSAWPPFLQAA